jgi:toxin ParE1/3/4
MRLKFGGPAEIDLEQIGDFIAARNPARAESFIGELREKATNIVNQPHAYAPRNDLSPGLREAIHKPYLILFRVTDNHVEIVRIVHGARDLKTLSFE